MRDRIWETLHMCQVRPGRQSLVLFTTVLFIGNVMADEGLELAGMSQRETT